MGLSEAHTRKNSFSILDAALASRSSVECDVKL